ncbi:hypothetical protein E2C01_018230 [Portunus trituberculatus]|uniref:Uncharacterized protein n=1 Tax=Portunus trituberculatus TaxID=210409 RepID=A0A5B7DVK7_PORTR|nr:hypothetical protein [Portunus trituberculatus]
MDTAITVVAAMIVRVKVIMSGVIAAGDENGEPTFETLLITLRKQQPLRMSTGLSIVFRQLRATGHGLISLLHELLKSGAVGDSHVGLGGITVICVFSGFD